MEKFQTKTVFLGVQKSKKPSKRNEKRLLNKVVDYLKYDYYMFAPLISPPPSDFTAPKMSSYFATVKLKEPGKGKQKIFIKKVWDYLKSDSYLYAPVVAAQPFSFRPTGEFWYIERVTEEISMRTLVTQDNQPTVCSPKDKPSKCNYSETKT